MKKKLAFITIGHNCDISEFVKYYLGLNIFSSPFEWNNTNIDSIVSIVKNNFKDFISKDIIPDKHPNPILRNTDAEWSYNNKYGMGFAHDTIPYIKNGIRYINKQEVINKYKRRIDRFYKICKEADEIIILRGEIGFTIDNYVENNPITIKNLQILYQLLKQTYHMKLFHIFCLNTRESFEQVRKFILLKLFDENYTLIYGNITKRTKKLYDKILNTK